MRCLRCSQQTHRQAPKLRQSTQLVSPFLLYYSLNKMQDYKRMMEEQKLREKELALIPPGTR